MFASTKNAIPVPNPASPRTHRASRSGNRSRNGRGALAEAGETMEFHRTEFHRSTSGQLLPVTLIGVVRYTDVARQVVTNLKYHGEKEVAADIAREIAQVTRWVSAPDIVTWIPTTQHHRTLRGFDHAELIARHAAAYIGQTAKCLLRRASQEHQTGRSREFRLSNVEFIASPRVRRCHVLVIDDVWTTGATFQAATKALINAGARSVACVAYAHVA